MRPPPDLVGAGAAGAGAPGGAGRVSPMDGRVSPILGRSSGTVAADVAGGAGVASFPVATVDGVSDGTGAGRGVGREVDVDPSSDDPASD
ncbi:MAG TPA: hypothetical protein VF320_02645, partial [Acidimicrobiales bacterium]